VNGTATKGPVADASVSAFAIDGSTGQVGAVIATTMTDSSGHFTMSIGQHSGPLMLQMMGGTYPDEATATSMRMGAADVMSAAIPSMPAGTTVAVQLTPLTSMAQRMALMMPGGMSAANLTQANAAMGAYFGVSDILAVAPMNATVTGSGAQADPNQRNYGMTIAAMSEYAHQVGMTTSSGMVTAMMSDASDGSMNGMMGSAPVDMMGMGGMMGGPGVSGGHAMMQADAGTKGMASAMTAFLQSPENKSGLTVMDMQPLIDKLQSSNGTIQ
jgi:hypothetical protein